MQIKRIGRRHSVTVGLGCKHSQEPCDNAEMYGAAAESHLRTASGVEAKPDSQGWRQIRLYCDFNDGKTSDGK